MKNGKTQILLTAPSTAVCEQATAFLLECQWLDIEVSTDIKQSANQIFARRLELDGIIIACLGPEEYDSLLGQWECSCREAQVLVVLKYAEPTILRWKRDPEKITILLKSGSARLAEQCLRFSELVRITCKK